jgi:hypothetical protein
MHSAPAIRYPVARPLGFAACLFGAWTLAGAVCLWWWFHGGATAWQGGFAALTLLASGVVGIAQWRGMPAGAMRWDGQVWWWQTGDEDEVLVGPQLHLDVQSGMLLHLAGLPRSAAWRYVTESSQPARWSDFRRAVYASTAPRAGVVQPS